ncbi:MAG: hypothetical protein COV35_07690 [Alphaproteobacteria bacterium CG11_big_fil_rev_8_21_14_0_20_39_49]|nr:MAG: hypothetical protein COV35_07690 [Alphaproteobacteria bacterium CG11_big_fil_rev_8_21_14_0_20_39_49]
MNILSSENSKLDFQTSELEFSNFQTSQTWNYEFSIFNGLSQFQVWKTIPIKQQVWKRQNLAPP